MARQRKAQSSAGLRAGAAEVDITPALGVQLAGSIGIRRPAEVVLEPLFARALVVEGGGRRVCILSLDLLAVTREYADAIRAGAAAQYGFDRDAVMVHVTQNHCSPSLGHLMCDEQNDLFEGEWRWMRGGDDRYHDVTVGRVLEAIGRACDSLQPVALGLARGMDDRVAINRRYVLRDGRAEMGHGGDPRNVLQREGPIDPEVGVACFTTPALKLLALLLHHTCHPVHYYPKRVVSGDWPGAWSAEMKRRLAPDGVPLVINGCCGNVHHANALQPGHTSSPEGIAEKLGWTARKALEDLRVTDAATVDFRARRIAIPYRAADPQALAAARERLARSPAPPPSPKMPGFVDWDWIYAVGLLDIERARQRSPTFEYEIQAYRIGELAVASVMGEPFVEGQLRIKLASPFPFTFLAHMSNGYIGYLPTPEALKRGGYETRMGWGSKLVPEALDMVVTATIDLLKELHAGA